jgi:hypothetical protein
LSYTDPRLLAGDGDQRIFVGSAPVVLERLEMHAGESANYFQVA